MSESIDQSLGDFYEKTIFTNVSDTGEVSQLNIFGSPYCKRFGNWSFMKDNEVLEELFDNLNSNLATDVLKTIVSEIMVEDPVTVEPTMTIGDLCELFAEKNIGGVPIVKNDNVIGIITERDVLNAVKRY